MIHPVVYLNRELARWLPILPPEEVKALLALMLAANAAGFLRTSHEAFAARVGTSPQSAGHLLDKLARRKLIYVDRNETAILVQIRGFLGGRGAPRDAQPIQ